MPKSRSASGFLFVEAWNTRTVCSLPLILGGSLHLYNNRAIQRVEEGSCVGNGKQFHPVEMNEDNDTIIPTIR
jgi:hypothetical protein